MTMAVFETLGLGAGFFHTFPEELESVSLEEMIGFLRDVLDPDRELQVVVGPAAADKGGEGAPPPAAPSR